LVGKLGELAVRLDLFPYGQNIKRTLLSVAEADASKHGAGRFFYHGSSTCATTAIVHACWLL
jgi:hypothetical protein